MSWIEAKTDWHENDYFEVEPDWNRICSNIKELAAYCKLICADVEILDMPKVTEKDFPFAETLNSVEKNMEILAGFLLKETDVFTRKIIVPNARLWDWQDLNRIEGAVAKLKFVCDGAAFNARRLSFILGGDYFGATV